MSKINVHHHDGVMFQKVTAESGITFVAIDPKEVDRLDRSFLVRHGHPSAPYCGYYPVWLLLADDETRKKEADKIGRMVPERSWRQNRITALLNAGAKFI